MSTYVYKVNPKGEVGQYSGDWLVFFSERQPCAWGLVEIVCEHHRPQPGARIICYQSNLREVVGTAKVVGYRRGKLVLQATEGPFPRGVKITDLKKIDQRIGDLEAFWPGVIRTLYPISDGDADHLLNTIRRFWVDADD